MPFVHGIELEYDEASPVDINNVKEIAKTTTHPTTKRTTRSVDQNNPENIELALAAALPLRQTFEFKIVVACEEDYAWATALLQEHGLMDSFTIMMGVSFGKLDPAELAEWMLRDRLRARMQLQLHKYIWDPALRGV